MHGIDMACTLEEAIVEAEALLLLVSHTEFRDLDPEELASKTKAHIAIDTVNGWDAENWQNAGFQFVRLGARKP
jgi:UDP-N-acetyl-D-mannosaminuronate dehydrogenase